jgi:hypothetical protein
MYLYVAYTYPLSSALLETNNHKHIYKTRGNAFRERYKIENGSVRVRALLFQEICRSIYKLTC